ncbi:MAG: hypothetical protein GEU78_00665 [Actinobacteria bacterium]|nr:hypothetical protein [Actinomycetota bacterium]
MTATQAFLTVGIMSLPALAFLRSFTFEYRLASLLVAASMILLVWTVKGPARNGQGVGENRYDSYTWRLALACLGFLMGAVAAIYTALNLQEVIQLPPRSQSVMRIMMLVGAALGLGLAALPAWVAARHGGWNLTQLIEWDENGFRTNLGRPWIRVPWSAVKEVSTEKRQRREHVIVHLEPPVDGKDRLAMPTQGLSIPAEVLAEQLKKRAAD